MTDFVPRRIRIEKDIIVRIYRTLSGKGKFSVALGQEVTPEEIIGSGESSGGFRILNLATLLDVSPKEARKYLKVTMGERIYKDELLAYKGPTLFKKAKIVTCPIDGIFDFINEREGEVRITRLPENIDLPAGVYGIVEALDKTGGQVVIRTQASRVYGIAGSGRMREGILHILTKRYDLAGKLSFSKNYEGGILLNGSLISRDGIRSAISMGVSGIITGGINASDYKSVAGGRLVFPKRLENDIGISIVVCEGFGSQPIGEDVYEILTKHEGRFVVTCGNKGQIDLPSYQSSCMNKIRKTQLPKEEGIIEEDETLALALGQRVRVIGPSYASEQGRVVAIDKSKTRLKSGIYAHLVQVETRRRKIQVPTTNVEVIP